MRIEKSYSQYRGTYERNKGEKKTLLSTDNYAIFSELILIWESKIAASLGSNYRRQPDATLNPIKYQIFIDKAKLLFCSLVFYYF